MVKLYYTPTSCGASSFICAFIAGLNFDCEIVDLSTHKTESGIDFYTINPKKLPLANVMQSFIYCGKQGIVRSVFVKTNTDNNDTRNRFFILYKLYYKSNSNK